MEASRPRVSIIIVAHNVLWCTRQCVRSVLTLTPAPYAIVLVDNGSTDGTHDYFQRVRQWVKVLRADPTRRGPWTHPGGCNELPESVIVLRNPENRGPSGGWNDGLRAAMPGATADALCILQNDTLVTKGWMNNLLACLYHDPGVGMVVPHSNGPGDWYDIWVPGVTYTSRSEMHRFAERFNRPDPSRWREIPPHRMFGVCMLTRREVVERVGLFDEQFARAWEDIDWAMRICQAGWKVMLAGDVFIHHYGHRTYIENRFDWWAQHGADTERFRRKWSLE